MNNGNKQAPIPATPSNMNTIQNAKLTVANQPSQPVNYGSPGKDIRRFEAPKTVEESLDMRIAEFERLSNELKQAKELAKNLKFTAGDVARHPIYGNVLITAVYCKATDGHSLGVNFADGVDFLYGIHYSNGSHHHHSSLDSSIVPIEELIPITELTHTLYNR